MTSERERAALLAAMTVVRFYRHTSATRHALGWPSAASFTSKFEDNAAIVLLDALDGDGFYKAAAKA